ncbi:MAG: hypothetical protein Q4F17_06880 [Eubacteriales bacterium]|nr:hypothetical protein [Eubacteriales bacterium]
MQREMPAGVGGFISFHILRKQNISHQRKLIFHILRQAKYFTKPTVSNIQPLIIPITELTSSVSCAKLTLIYKEGYEGKE